MNELLFDLQRTLAQDIPITQHMQITIEGYDDKGLILKAPLAGNTNPKGTAFAGCINSLVTLAGWGQLWLLLRELEIPAYVVIQDNYTSYLHSVTENFAAFCYRPTQEEIDRLAQSLRKKGKARMELNVEIRQGDKIAVEFKGRYVVRV